MIWIAAALCVAVACDEPTEPDSADVEIAYLLDRVNGAAPPGPICEQGGVDQTLQYESVALLKDSTYGRLQITQIGSGTPVQQEERGDFTRTASAILLINAEEDTLVLTLLDEEGDYVRRIHTCGDTLRYVSVPVTAS